MKYVFRFGFNPDWYVMSRVPKHKWYVTIKRRRYEVTDATRNPAKWLRERKL